jgi:predicted dehydrogenase
MTVRVGFLGAGFISRFHHLFLSSTGVDHEITAVHDPDPERAASLAATAGGWVAGEDELLDLVDAVYVTSWTSEHPRLVAKAAAAGKAVFCEKPLGVDGSVAAGMVDVVERAGVTNQVGLVLRFMPPSRLVRHLLADERAGRVLAVVFRDDQFIPTQGQYASTWRSDPARAGRGAMLEHSIHDVDILRWWLGPVASLSAATREYHGHHRIDDVAAVRFDFESGAVATLVSVWHDILERPSMRHIELFCERLHIVVEGDLSGPVRWQFTGEPACSLAGDELTAELARRGDVGSNPARTFLDAVAAGRPASPCFADALPAHRIVDSIYRSADAGGRLVTDAEHPDPGE